MRIARTYQDNSRRMMYMPHHTDYKRKDRMSKEGFVSSTHELKNQDET